MNASTSAKLGIAAASLASLLLLASLLRPAPSAPYALPSLPFLTLLTPATHAEYTAPPGTIVHIVLFAYTPSTSPAQKAAIAAAFVGLQRACIHPSSKKPYILSVDGGPNHSPEDVGQAHEHAFVLTFASRADRDYYVDSDPAHAAFKASLAGAVSAATVADYDAAAFPAGAAPPVHVRAV